MGKYPPGLGNQYEPPKLEEIEMDDFFNTAMEFTFVNEGGLSNSPNDHGGLTNLGLIRDDFEEYYGRPTTDADIRSCTRELATKIYRRLYWDKPRINQITDKALAITLFDRCVLRGRNGTPRDVRNILDIPENSDWIAAANTADPVRLIKFICFTAMIMADQRIAKERSQADFGEGWDKRFIRIFGLVDPVAAEMAEDF